jgi:hypothetical protein
MGEIKTEVLCRVVARHLAVERIFFGARRTFTIVDIRGAGRF